MNPATQAIRAEVERLKKRLADITAREEAKIAHLLKSAELLEEGEAEMALKPPRPALVLRPEHLRPRPPPPPSSRIPEWFAAAEAIFADGQPHHVGEVVDAVKRFEVDRKAVSVWLSRRIDKEWLERPSPGMYRLKVAQVETG